MSFHKSRDIIEKGKETPLKKVTPEEDIGGLQDLRIDKNNMYKEERKNKMS